jgi:hypothetical protein
MESFLKRHAAKIVGHLSCLDRVVITGTLPALCYREGMMHYLLTQHIPFYDFPQWAATWHEKIRECAEAEARQAGLEIRFVRNHDKRKEEIVQGILQERGTHPGLVAILSAMERCPTYRPQRDRQSGRRWLKADSGKCLHYYFYLIDPWLGLIYLRLPTWAPFGLQFYFNGHGALESALRSLCQEPRFCDNALVATSDWAATQQIADTLIEPARLHRTLEDYARRFCPPARELAPDGYHWSLAQVELSSDVIFHSAQALCPLYEELARTAILSVKVDDVATFLGRPIHPLMRQEVTNRFDLQVQGRRIRHQMGEVSVKMYDKFGSILRVETTTNDVTFFRHHRRVEHKDGTWEMKVAPMRKTIYSLPELQGLLLAANGRYLEHLSAIEDPAPRLKELNRLGRPEREDDGRSSRGFNLFDDEDLELCRTLLRGEFTISGLRNRQLQGLLDKTGHQVSHLLKRLRLHGMLKKVGRTYKYYLTDLGRRVIAAGVRLRRALVIPALTLQLAEG